MRLIIVKSDKDDLGEETLDRIVDLTQEYETPYTQEETESILIQSLRSNEVVNDFMHVVFLGEDLDNVSGRF